ncbi:MAG: universal stress protein [Bdellovibrio sp.]|jgi:nucleotide-binding universal stress UspA family protein
MKALWAFEPFHQDEKRLKGMHDTLSLLVGSPSKVEVGFVVTRTESSLNLAFDIPEDERFSIYPRRLIKQELKKARIKQEDRNIHVIDYPTMSNTKSVDRLLKLASDRGADLIGLFTHARKGYLRLAIGSFAETAIHRSKLSLLIFNPQTKVAPRIKNVLYTSDFSPASKKHLKTVLAYCKKLESDLTVFHQAEVIYKWSGDESNPKIHAYRRKVDRMKTWIEQECQRSGISVDVIVASEFKATSDLIFENMKKKRIDLVAVSAKAGPLAALMGGSITRQIVRGSNVPILVLK